MYGNGLSAQQAHATPVNEATVQAVPIQGAPAKDGSVPVAQAMPVQAQAMPVQAQAMPVQAQAMPIQAQAMPVQAQPAGNAYGNNGYGVPSAYNPPPSNGAPQQVQYVAQPIQQPVAPVYVAHAPQPQQQYMVRKTGYEADLERQRAMNAEQHARNLDAQMRYDQQRRQQEQEEACCCLALGALCCAALLAAN